MITQIDTKKWKASHGTLPDNRPSRRFKSNEYCARTVSVPCSHPLCGDKNANKP